MSKFRQLVESVLLEADLLEGLVSSTAPVANLVNALDKSLRTDPLVDDRDKPISHTPIEIKLVGTGKDKRKRDEIVSYYLNITTKKMYIIRGKPITLPITIKCRCSTHDKPDQEENPPKDINVFVPDPSNPKPIYRNGIDCYDLSQTKLPDYIDKAREAIAIKLVEKRNHMCIPLYEITHNDKMYNDLLTKTDQYLVERYKSLNYGKILFQPYFRAWLKQIKSN